MASNTARKFWENGIPLYDAWTAFADDATKSKLQGTPDFAAAINQFAKDLETAGFSNWRGEVLSHFERSQERQQLVESMKEGLLIQLFNSQLVATGKREYPSLGSNIVRIDASNFYEGSPDWENSKFSANGRKWGSIKISPPPIHLEQKSKGSRAAIIQAIRELSLGGLDFNSITRKVGAQLIRVKLCREYEKGNGLSDVNLAKLIVEEYGEKSIS